jgi:hypothetical protein
MEERRKIRDRRVNPPKESLPGYYTRRIADRRQSTLAPEWKHWTEYDIDLITRCLTDNQGC